MIISFSKVSLFSLHKTVDNNNSCLRVFIRIQWFNINKALLHCLAQPVLGISHHYNNESYCYIKIMKFCDTWYSYWDKGTHQYGKVLTRATLPWVPIQLLLIKIFTIHLESIVLNSLKIVSKSWISIIYLYSNQLKQIWEAELVRQKCRTN